MLKLQELEDGKHEKRFIQSNQSRKWQKNVNSRRKIQYPTTGRAAMRIASRSASSGWGSPFSKKTFSSLSVTLLGCIGDGRRAKKMVKNESSWTLGPTLALGRFHREFPEEPHLLAKNSQQKSCKPQKLIRWRINAKFIGSPGQQP